MKNKKPKHHKTNTMLQCLYITTLEQDVETPEGLVPVEDWADNNGYTVFDGHNEEYYPTLYKEGEETIEIGFTVDGMMTTQIITGSHPTHRPK